MITTVTTPIAGISPSLHLPPPNSTSKMFSGGSHTCNCKASFHAVLDAKPMAESLYEVLRVGRNATTTEIKTAYRNLAKVYHPDASEFKQHGGDRDFVEIHKAYETLSDPEARAMYDLKWSTGLRRKGGLYSTVVGRRSVFCGGRRWETDQCW